MDEFIEEVDIRFLLRYAAFPPTYLSPTEIYDLTSSIEKNGIISPLRLAINPNTKHVRLDIGNHRVYVCSCLGFTTLPTVAYVSNIDIPTPENGLHYYPSDAIIIKPVKKPYYCKPKDAMRIE